jgi:antitoxin component of RelBE/YafQ-DinJ toxin-antitoxin module
MKAPSKAKPSEIRIRIEPDLKNQSAEVLSALGLDLSGAMTEARKMVAAHRSTP